MSSGDWMQSDLTTNPTVSVTLHQPTQTQNLNVVNATQVTDKHHVTGEEEEDEDNFNIISTEMPNDFTMDGHDAFVNTSHASVSSDPEVTAEEDNFPTFPSLVNDTFGPQSIREMTTSSDTTQEITTYDVTDLSTDVTTSVGQTTQDTQPHNSTGNIDDHDVTSEQPITFSSATDIPANVSNFPGTSLLITTISTASTSTSNETSSPESLVPRVPSERPTISHDNSTTVASTNMPNSTLAPMSEPSTPFHWPVHSSSLSDVIASDHGAVASSEKTKSSTSSVSSRPSTGTENISSSISITQTTNTPLSSSTTRRPDVDLPSVPVSTDQHDILSTTHKPTHQMNTSLSDAELPVHIHPGTSSISGMTLPRGGITTHAPEVPFGHDVIIIEKVRLVFLGLADELPSFADSIVTTLKNYLNVAVRLRQSASGGHWSFSLQNDGYPGSADNQTTFVDVTLRHSYETEISKLFERLQLVKFFQKHAGATLITWCRPRQHCDRTALATYQRRNRTWYQRYAPVLITVASLCGVCIIVMVIGFVCLRKRRRGSYEAEHDMEGKVLSTTRPCTARPSPFTDAQIMRDEGEISSGSYSPDDDNDGGHHDNWVVPLEEAVDLDVVKSVHMEDTQF